MSMHDFARPRFATTTPTSLFPPLARGDHRGVAATAKPPPTRRKSRRLCKPERIAMGVFLQRFIEFNILLASINRPFHKSVNESRPSGSGEPALPTAL